jgi:hypothetical protein
MPSQVRTHIFTLLEACQVLYQIVGGVFSMFLPIIKKILT